MARISQNAAAVGPSLRGPCVYISRVFTAVEGDISVESCKPPTPVDMKHRHRERGKCVDGRESRENRGRQGQLLSVSAYKKHGPVSPSPYVGLIFAVRHHL